MCHPVRCRTCDKTTWAGCGAHIDAVRARVVPEQWCPGHDISDEPRARRRRWLR